MGFGPFGLKPRHSGDDMRGVPLMELGRAGTAESTRSDESSVQRGVRFAEEARSCHNPNPGDCGTPRGIAESATDPGGVPRTGTEGHYRLQEEQYGRTKSVNLTMLAGDHSHGAQARHRTRYCIVMYGPEPESSDRLKEPLSSTRAKHTEIVLNHLTKAGLTYRIGTHYHYTKVKKKRPLFHTVIIIDCPEERLREEHVRFKGEQWLASNGTTTMHGVSFLDETTPVDDADMKLPAYKMELISRILSSVDVGASIDVELKSSYPPTDFHSSIKAVFPLHDDVGNRHLMSEFFRVPLYKRLILGKDSRRIVHKCRAMFGDEIGFYLGFADFYTKLLAMLSVGGVCIGMLSLVSESAYFCGVWGPLLIAYWKRRENYFSFFWGSYELSPALYPNPNYAPPKEMAHISNKLKQTLNLDTKEEAIQRALDVRQEQLKCTTLTQKLTSISVLALVTALNVYIGIFMTDSFVWISLWKGLSPLEHWFVILGHGIVWGLTIDVALWSIYYPICTFLNNNENYRTNVDYKSNMSIKVFVFYFVGMFSYFLLISFLYVPFGVWWSESTLHRYVMPLFSYTYNPELIDLRKAFLTPMVVTQLLNLLLDGVVPFVHTRIRNWTQVRLEKIDREMSELVEAAVENMIVAPLNYVRESVASSTGEETSGKSEKPPVDRSHSRGSSSYLKQVQKHEASTLLRTIHAMMDEAKQGKRSVTAMRQRLNDFSLSRYLEAPIKRGGSMIESVLGYKALATAVWMNTDIEDEVFTTSGLERVMEQARQPSFDPIYDYARFMMQLGYTLMFSGCWPWIALVACIHNVFKMQSDIFKLYTLHQRKIPMKTKSIGNWNLAIRTTVYIAYVVTCCLACFSTGGLEWFYGCPPAKERHVHLRLMAPNYDCLSGRDRVMVVLIAEHLLVLGGLFITTNVNSVPPKVRNRIYQNNFKFKAVQLRRSQSGLSSRDSSPTLRPTNRKEEIDIAKWRNEWSHYSSLALSGGELPSGAEVILSHYEDIDGVTRATAKLVSPELDPLNTGV